MYGNSINKKKNFCAPTQPMALFNMRINKTIFNLKNKINEKKKANWNFTIEISELKY